MTFSASRTQTWLACQRKAGWEYICGYKEAEKEGGARDIGSLVHATLENYKTLLPKPCDVCDGSGADDVKRCIKCGGTGAVPTFELDLSQEIDAIAAEAIPYVEAFTLENGSEFEAHFKIQGRHLWQGYKDIRRPGAPPAVVDYKTTTDFKYAKTEQELLHDPQAVLYAVDEFVRDPDATHVELTWLYIHKRRRACQPVRVIMSREHAMRCFAHLEAIADDFATAAIRAPAGPAERHKYVLDVLQPNFDHCGAYGGCDHKDRCAAPFFVNPSMKGASTNMGLLERLQAEDNGAPPPPPTRPMTPMMGVPSPIAVGGRPTLAFSEQSAAGTVTTFSPSFCAPDGGPAPTERELPVAAETTPPPPEPAEGINPPKRPGRPKGSKNKPKEEPAPTVAQASADLAVSLSAPAPANVPEPHHRIKTLYVGCALHGPKADTDVVDFDMFAMRAKQAIGLQVYFQGYGYKSNGALLNMVQAMVDFEKPETMIVSHPNSPEASLCLSYLRAVSDTVVEALR